MQTVNICGNRGLGDLVSGISHALQTIKEDSHFVFHYPPGFDYTNTINVLMDEFIPPSFTVTHEVLDDWYTVNPAIAAAKYGRENLSKTWFFTSSMGGRYVEFKSQWLGNKDGPIALCLNNENNNDGYPHPEKWFDKNTNDYLMSLVDDKRFMLLGRPLSLRENIKRLAECSMMLGVDGGWFHISNAMRVPCVMTRNNISLSLMKQVHHRHPTLKIIETHRLFDFIN